MNIQSSPPPSGIAVTVPEESADSLRAAVGSAGAGKIGNYIHCSFSSKGLGRFLPVEGAHPAIGEVGKTEVVAEERIEWTCAAETVDAVVSAIRAVHPYEEVVIDVYPLQKV
jgi:hypothetical protein